MPNQFTARHRAAMNSHRSDYRKPRDQRRQGRNVIAWRRKPQVFGRPPPDPRHDGVAVVCKLIDQSPIELYSPGRNGGRG